MKKLGFIKGGLLGATLGAVAALLLAPKSGKETQADIKNKLSGTYHDLQNQLRDLGDEVAAKIDSLKAAAQDVKGDAKKDSQDLVKRAEVLKQDLRIAASKVAKNGAKVKNDTLNDAQALFDEGVGVAKELEKLTKSVASSAKTKLTDAARKN
jgi:gas vesicle protein